MNEAMLATRGRRWAPGMMLGISLAVTVLALQYRVVAHQILNGATALEHMTSDRGRGAAGFRQLA
jgi:hypothetical protein